MRLARLWCPLGLALLAACHDDSPTSPDCGVLRCEPEVLAIVAYDVNWPTFHAFDGSLYWSTRLGEVHRFEIGARVHTTLATVELPQGALDEQFPLAGLTVIGDTVYFSMEAVDGVLSVPITGGEVTTVFPGAAPDFITGYGGRVLWITGDGEVKSGDPVGGGVIDIASLMDFLPTPIVAGGGYVYGSTTYYGLWRLKLENPDGGIGKVDKEYKDYYAASDLGVAFSTAEGLTFRSHDALDAAQLVSPDASREVTMTDVGVLWHNPDEHEVFHWVLATGEVEHYRGFSTDGGGVAAITSDADGFYWVDAKGGRIWAVGRPRQ